MAASSSIQPPANMDAVIALLQRLERRLDANEQRAAASWPPRPNPDPPYGMPWDCQPPSSWDPPAQRHSGIFQGQRSSWEQSTSCGPSSSYEFDPILGRPLTSWDLPRPRIAPELCSNRSDWNYSVPCAFDPPPQQPTYSESYGGGGGYSYNNYESQAWSYNNYESQAQSYNNYELERYSQAPRTLQYEPPPPVQYYFVAEPPLQQQHYYLPPPSYTLVSDVDATMDTDVNDSEIRVYARGNEIAAEPQRDEIGEVESTPMADPKLEVADADAGYEQQFSELQTELNVGGDVPNPVMEEVDEEKKLSSAEHDEALGIDSERRDKVGEENGDFMEKDLEFGDGDSNQGIEEQRWKLIGQYIASNGGVVTAEELAPKLDVETTERTDDDSYILPVLLQFDDLSEVDDESRIVEEVFLEVSRFLVIFGLYALAEVYKDLHLEDKVIFKGGGVDTYLFYFN